MSEEVGIWKLTSLMLQVRVGVCEFGAENIKHNFFEVENNETDTQSIRCSIQVVFTLDDCQLYKPLLVDTLNNGSLSIKNT